MLYQTKIENVSLDVYYDLFKTTETNEAGERQSVYDIDFNSIETTGDSVNLMSITSEHILMIIETEIIAYERGKDYLDGICLREK